MPFELSLRRQRRFVRATSPGSASQSRVIASVGVASAAATRSANTVTSSALTWPVTSSADTVTQLTRDNLQKDVPELDNDDAIINLAEEHNIDIQRMMADMEGF